VIIPHEHPFISQPNEGKRGSSATTTYLKNICRSLNEFTFRFNNRNNNLIFDKVIAVLSSPALETASAAVIANPAAILPFPNGNQMVRKKTKARKSPRRSVLACPTKELVAREGSRRGTKCSSENAEGGGRCCVEGLLRRHRSFTGDVPISIGGKCGEYHLQTASDAAY